MARVALLLPVAAALSPAARAEGYSLDIELLRPTFSTGQMFGVDSPVIRKEGEFRYGTYLQYQRAPLVIYEFDQEAGDVVGNRLQAHAGISYDPYPNLSARLTLPLALQWGSSDAGDAVAPGTGGLGDIGVGFRYTFLQGGPLALGLRGDLFAPTSASGAYLGERFPRFNGGVVSSLGFGPAEVLVDINAMTRTVVPTEQDFDLGTEASANGAFRYHAVPEFAAVGVSVLDRFGVEQLFQGGAENTFEVVAGTQLWPSDGLQLDIGVGRGFIQGYGTTKARVLVGLTWTITPPEPPPEPEQIVVISEIPQMEEPEPEPEWEEGQLARIEKKQIVIKEPIEFEVDTANILPESKPILAQVANIMNSNAQIAHLLVEGHASEEGTFEHNFDLSNRRALAVWQGLIEAGVHPSRIGYRGMGEVVPRKQGSDEASLQENRRVEFHIIRELDALEIAPEYAPVIQLPWSGAEKVLETPKEKTAAPTQDKPVEKFDVEGFKESVEEDGAPKATVEEGAQATPEAPKATATVEESTPSATTTTPEPPKPEEAKPAEDAKPSGE